MTENKGDVVAGVYYRSPCQGVSTDELFYRHLGQICGLVALVLMGDFSFQASTGNIILLWQAGLGNSLSSSWSARGRRNRVISGSEVSASQEDYIEQCGLYRQGEDTKGQSSIRVESGLCCVR